MGLGNGNAKHGDKGSNFNYEMRHLKLLGEMLSQLNFPTGGLASESTLQAILAKEDIEFQMQYFKDATGALVWVEVRQVDGVNQYFYYDSPGGGVVVPTLPLQPFSLQNDIEMIEDRYIAVASGTGYTVGDLISRVNYFDVSNASPILVGVFWYNKSTSTIMGTAPLLADLENENGPILQNPGVSGMTISVDGTYPLSFDADSILIENETGTTVTCELDGILGGPFDVLDNTAKRIEIGVPHISAIIVTGLTGDLEITYSRNR